jgi:hypothetical protein
MQTSKEKLPHSNNPANTAQKSHPPRPSAAGGKFYGNVAILSDEMGYGRIVRLVKAVPKK